MTLGDLVIFQCGNLPVVGQVVGFTPKRVRVTFRNGIGYSSVTRKKTNLRVEKKAKRLI